MSFLNNLAKSSPLVIDAIDTVVEGKEEEEKKEKEATVVTHTTEGNDEKEKESKTIDRARLRRLIAKYTLYSY